MEVFDSLHDTKVPVSCHSHLNYYYQQGHLTDYVRLLISMHMCLQQCRVCLMYN